ncbi:hypothetical protein [Enterococcus raffinosus]|uniref:hypothetical protein n=1 Tax=Enterococcus raffinosus TaxID=71452 RepID=UPI00356311B9
MDDKRFIKQCENRLRYKQIRELLKKIDEYLVENNLTQTLINKVYLDLDELQTQLAVDYFQNTHSKEDANEPIPSKIHCA